MYTSSQIRELLNTITDDESMSTVEQRVDIQTAIAALPTAQQRLVVFALVQGYSDIHAAALLGLKTTPARILIRKVLACLRDALNQGEERAPNGPGGK
jgi:DNA-directed RNA polymerase specialized sigma24 family protein